MSGKASDSRRGRPHDQRDAEDDRVGRERRDQVGQPEQTISKPLTSPTGAPTRSTVSTAGQAERRLAGEDEGCDRGRQTYLRPGREVDAAEHDDGELPERHEGERRHLHRQVVRLRGVKK